MLLSVHIFINLLQSTTSTTNLFTFQFPLILLAQLQPFIPLPRLVDASLYNCSLSLSLSLSLSIGQQCRAE